MQYIDLKLPIMVALLKCISFFISLSTKAGQINPMYINHHSDTARASLERKGNTIKIITGFVCFEATQLWYMLILSTFCSEL